MSGSTQSGMASDDLGAADMPPREPITVFPTHEVTNSVESLRDTLVDVVGTARNAAA